MIRTTTFFFVQSQEMLNHQRNVFFALSQRRNDNREHLGPEIQIFPESAFGDALMCQVAEFSKTPGLREIQVYSHAHIPGDICITLNWDTNRPVQTGSEPGIGLVEFLKRSGIVAHSIWLTYPGTVR